MIGIVLLTLWVSITVAYLVRQQLRGDLAGQHRAVPPLPWRGPSAALPARDLHERAA